MVLNEFMAILYQNELMLKYLRYHPKWYKILEVERNYDAFLKEAKEKLNLRLYDKLENIKKDVKLLKTVEKIFNKK